MEKFEKPQFLSESQLRALKRNACIFCQDVFKVDKEEREIEIIRRGDHYSSDHVDNVLVRTYKVTGPNVYSFNFSFDEETKTELERKEKIIVAELEDRKRAGAEELRAKLSKELYSLPEKERTIAIEAIVNDYLREIQKTENVSSFGLLYKSKLKIEVAKLFHNLQFGDLQLVWDISHYCTQGNEEEGGKPSEIDCIHTYYNPVGLKSHKRCWPFKNFYGSVSFAVKSGELFAALKRNQIFADYDSLFGEYQESWEYILGRQITINSDSHNLSGDFV